MTTVTEKKPAQVSKGDAMLAEFKAENERYHVLLEEYNERILGSLHCMGDAELTVRRINGQDVSTPEARQTIVENVLLVRRLGEQAGNSKAREAAESAAKKAAADRKARLSVLTQTIYNAQIEVDAIAKQNSNGGYTPKPTDEETRFKLMDNACQQLRAPALLPPWINAQQDTEINGVANDLRRKISSLKSELQRIEGVIFADLSTPADSLGRGAGQTLVLNYAKSKSHDGFGIKVEHLNTAQQRLVLSPEWEAHADELESRRHVILTELDGLEESMSAACLGAQSHLNYHVARLG